MPDFILDSWGIIAWLKGQEPAAGRMRLLLEAAERQEHRLGMNIINLGEVFYISAKAKDVAYSERLLKELKRRVSLTPANDQMVMNAALLKARYPISYADAFAAGTALLHKVPLVTGDRELKHMAESNSMLQLRWIAD